MEWIDDPLRPARRALLDEKGETDPGEVDLLPANREIRDVYLLTRNQVVTAGAGQPISVSIPAIKVVMDLLGITDQATCLKRVVRLWHDVDGKRQADAR